MSMEVNGSRSYPITGFAGQAKERCTGSTDKVDSEIKSLKEKKQQLEQQIRSAYGDERRVRNLEKILAQTENELSRKDNHAYRRAHSEYKNDGRPGGGKN